MVEIFVENASLSIPLVTNASRSIKASLLKPLTSRRLDTSAGRAQVTALTDVNLHLKEGMRLGLQGPNGAGKSTLLRLLAGIYSPTSGRRVCRGRVTTLIDMQAGMMPQATGRENVYLRGAYQGLNRKQIADMMAEIEDFTQVGEFFDLPLSTYSLGMRARLSFAVNTALPPEILLIDEGISVGDAAFQAAAQKRLDSFKEQAKILVLATHSPALMAQFCSHYVEVESGKVGDVLPLDDAS